MADFNSVNPMGAGTFNIGNDSWSPWANKIENFITAEKNKINEIINAGRAADGKTTALTGRVSPLEIDVGALKPQVTTLNRDVGTLKTDVGTLKTDVGTLKTDVGTLETDVGTLKTEVSTLKPKVNTLESNTKILDGKVKLLEDGVANQTQALAVLDLNVVKRTHDLAQQIADLGAAFDGENTGLKKEWQSDFTNLTKKQNDTSQELQVLQTNLHSWNATTKEKLQLHEVKFVRLEEINKDYKERFDKQEDINNNSLDCLKKHNDFLFKHEREIGENSGKIKAQRQLTDIHDRDIAEHKSNVRGQSDSLNELKNKHTRFEGRIDLLEYQINHLDKMCKEIAPGLISLQVGLSNTLNTKETQFRSIADQANTECRAALETMKQMKEEVLGVENRVSSLLELGNQVSELNSEISKLRDEHLSHKNELLGKIETQEKIIETQNRDIIAITLKQEKNDKLMDIFLQKMEEFENFQKSDISIPIDK